MKEKVLKSSLIVTAIILIVRKKEMKGKQNVSSRNFRNRSMDVRR